MVRFTQAGNAHGIVRKGVAQDIDLVDLETLDETHDWDGVPNSTLNTGSVRDMQRKEISFPGDDLLAFLAPPKAIDASLVPRYNFQAPLNDTTPVLHPLSKEIIVPDLYQI
ncbi:hypothetical protein BKA70DRAFT_1421681 [Coprinopsis sp. MPI-PUGE-AT-0042]|nr:hypothetical protein BKA70DRAFT_1421681 [Coprinopsis sp. MPI-PUGE-AT-0042]